MFNKILNTINKKYTFMYICCILIPIASLVFQFLYLYNKSAMEREKELINYQIKHVLKSIDTATNDMKNIAISMYLNRDINTLLSDELNPPSYPWFNCLNNIYLSINTLDTQSRCDYVIKLIGNEVDIQSQSGYYESITWNSSITKKLISNNADFKITNIDNIPTIAKIIKKQNKPVGMILVGIPYNTIANIFEEIDGHAVNILYSDTILYSSGDYNNLIENNLILHGQKQNNDLLNINGTYHWYQINNVPSINGEILTLLPKNYIFNKSTTLLYISIFYIIFAFTVCTLLFFKFTRSIPNRINSLNNKLRDFNENSIETYQPINVSDEVDSLNNGFVIMSNKIKILLQEIREKEKEKSKQDFMLLQSQIHPHMIYNTLNTISNLAYLQGIKNIEEVSVSFSSLLRLISNSQEEYITIYEEIEYIKKYISIKKYNILWEINVFYSIDENLKNKKILKLLLQPIVENAYIHAFTAMSENNNIFINIYQQSKNICIEIIDNGIGIEQKIIDNLYREENAPSNSFINVGLYSTYRRLQLYYNNPKFKITRENNQTKVYIEYPE
ncbi:MAG: sensor histidine kinase [Lachnospirales bacterium]